MIFKISTILLLSTGITSPFAINLSNSQIPVPSDNPNAYHLDAHFIRPGSGDEFDAHINTINLTWQEGNSWSANGTGWMGWYRNSSWNKVINLENPEMYHYSSQSIGYDPPTYQYFSSGYKLDPTGCPLGDFFITCNNNSLSVVVHSIYFKTGGGSSYFDYPPINWHDTEIRDLTSNKAGWTTDWSHPNDNKYNPTGPLLDVTSFDKNKLFTIDYDNSYFLPSDQTSQLVIKFNNDYIAADLMSWDCNINQVAGKKDSKGHYDNSNWVKQPDIAQFAKMLPQYALDDISNAIISGKIINTGSPSGIFEWAFPNFPVKPFEWYGYSDSQFSLLNFLIFHAHDDQTTLETAISNLPILKWKNDYDYFHIDITSALQFNNYLSLVTNLLTTTNRSNQNSLKFKLTYVTSATPQGQTSSFEFTLADIVGGSLPPLLFTYLDEDHVNFQLQKIETADGCLDAFQANATYGIWARNRSDADEKVYSLDGQQANFCNFYPEKFILSKALDEIDGKPREGNNDSDLFFGTTGMDAWPAAWSVFTRDLYSCVPSKIKEFIDDGQVPASWSGTGSDVPFDETCFIKVKDSFTSEFNIDDIVDHIDYIPNDATGHLLLTIHFKDETSGDTPQTLDVGLFAKQVSIWQHSRSTPLKDIEPSQINQQYIIDNLIKYNSTPNAQADDDDPYLFETNLNKTEFTQALQGITFKVQDDAEGKLDVIFSIRSLVYNANETGMNIPPLTTFEIMDNDFIPLHPSNVTNLTALWVILGIVGVSGIVITPILIKRRGKKYNTNYDEEVEEELNQRKHAAKKSGKDLVADEIIANAKSELKPKSKWKSFFKRKSKNLPETKITSQEDIEAIGG